MATRWTRLGVVTLFWTLDGLALALGSSSAFDHKLLTSVLSCQLWIPYTLLTLALTARFPIAPGRVARGLIVHASATALVVLTRPLLFVVTDPWLDWPTSGLSALMLNSVRFSLFIYLLVVGATHAVYFGLRERERERRAERLEAQLAHARLAALRSQLQPHFLFNALGGIAELIHSDPRTADRMLVRLARMLRVALDESDKTVVTLGHELRCLEPYLELEKMRYGDRLTVVMEIEPAAREAWVPGLLLQPIVENAIRHGIAPRSAPGTVTIRARLQDASVQLEIEDDGVGLPPRPSIGVGLRNTRARLAELYGDTSDLELHGRPGGGARVRVQVPQEAAA